MNKSEKVTLLATIVLIGFALAVIYHYILGFYMGANYPYSTFLSPHNLLLSDFLAPFSQVSKFNPFEKPDFWINYFPLAYIILYPFTLIKNPIFSYLIFISGFITSFTYLNWKFLNCKDLVKVQNLQNIFVLSFFSYPFLYILDRGNFDMFLFVLFASFVYAFKVEKYFFAGILIAIANACKPFFVLFLFLFLFKKKYKEFFVSIILSALLIIFGFMVLKGGWAYNFSIFIENLKLTQDFFIYKINGGLVNTSSLFMTLKALLCYKFNLISINSLLGISKYISIALTGLALFFAYKEKAFWKQISLMTLTMLVVPYIVFDYKLLFLFVPMWLFVNNNEKSKFDLAYTILFGLLFVSKALPLDFVIYIEFSVVINSLIMILFMGLIIFEQFQLKSIREVENE